MPTFREACTALKDQVALLRVRRDAQRLGHEVVLLNELFGQVETTGCIDADRLEVPVLEQTHLACHSLAWRSEARRPKSYLETGPKLRLSFSSLRSGTPISWPSAPSIARTRGGSSIAGPISLSNARSWERRASKRLTVSAGDKSLVWPRSRRNSNIAPSRGDKRRRESGRRLLTLASRRRGPCSAGVAYSRRAGFWVVKPSMAAAVRPVGCKGSPTLAAVSAWLLGVLSPRIVARDRYSTPGSIRRSAPCLTIRERVDATAEGGRSRKSLRRQMRSPCDSISRRIRAPAVFGCLPGVRLRVAMAASYPLDAKFMRANT